MGELNHRDLRAVLRALKEDGERLKDELEKVTVEEREYCVPEVEKQALYLHASKLFRQLPEEHALRNEFDSHSIILLARLLSDGNARDDYEEAIKIIRGNYSKIGLTCCVKRIADDLAGFFSQKGTVVDTKKILVSDPVWEELNMRAYKINGAKDDDGKTFNDAVRAYVGWKPQELGHGEIHLRLKPVFNIDGLEGLIKKHNLVSVGFTDECYYEYGITTDHPMYEHVKKGEIPLQDFVEPCECPKPAKTNEAQDYNKFEEIVGKRYSLDDDIVRGLQEIGNSCKGLASQGWKGMEWYVILPKPLAPYFAAHANHAIHDALHAHGNPEGMEWKINGVDSGSIIEDGKETIPDDKKGTLVLISCAYDTSKFSSMVYNGNAPPATALVESVIQEIDIQDSLGTMQIHAVKKPGSDWERRTPSRLLL